MAGGDSGSDIVELGVEIEHNGEVFYAAMAAKVDDRKAAELFAYLAGEERKHAVTFRRILESVKSYSPAEAFPEEYFAFVRERAGSYVFTRPDEGRIAAESITGLRDAVLFAVKIEEDSIKFYDAMKQLIPEGDRNLLDVVIAEEKGHLKRLQGLSG